MIESNHNIPVMLSVKETAVNFGIARHFARQLALTGKVKATRAGNKILINQQSVIDFFNSCNLDDTKQSKNPTFKPISAKL